MATTACRPRDRCVHISICTSNCGSVNNNTVVMDTMLCFSLSLSLSLDPCVQLNCHSSSLFLEITIDTVYMCIHVHLYTYRISATENVCTPMRLLAL